MNSVLIAPNGAPTIRGKGRNEHNLFEPIENGVHSWAHPKFNWRNVYSQIFADAQTELFRLNADHVSCARLCVGLVTQPYEPMSVDGVVNHYTADKLITSPFHLAILFARLNQDGNRLSYKMANLFFWRVRTEVRLVVLGRCESDRWVLRTYPLNEAPSYLAGCRIFIPA